MYITWLGQSGYLIQSGEATICLDAYLSDAVFHASGKKRMIKAPVSPEEIHADVVICTHDHLDHLDPVTVKELANTKAMFLAPSACKETMMSLGVKQYISFDRGSTAVIGPFVITAVFAHHTIPAIGVVITCEGQSMYFTGDTYTHPELEKLADKSLDYLFICINGKLGNMNVQEAIELTKKIKPKTAVPNHYGMFLENTEDPHIYAEQVDNCFVMEVGRKYEVTKECLI